MKNEKQLTHEEWIDTYKPLIGMHDDEIMTFDSIEDIFIFLGENPQTINNQPDTWDKMHKKIWTETAGDGWYYISTGFHCIDRMHHFICEVPWKEENEASVYEDQGTWCDDCDDYTENCKHKEIE